MTTKMITAVAMAVALVAACAGSALAGHGGNGLPGTGGALFSCYFVSFGAKSGSVLVDLNDQFTDPTNVEVGTAQLLCTPADATDVRGNFDAFHPGENPDHILCYDLKQPSGPAPNTVVTLRDPLAPGSRQTVKVTSTKYVCVEAIKTCESGCPVE